MDIDSYSKKKQSFLKIKKLFKPFILKKHNSNKKNIKNNDASGNLKEKSIHSGVRNYNFNLLCNNNNNNNNTITSDNYNSNSECDSEAGSSDTFESHSSIGTWVSENTTMFTEYEYIKNNDFSLTQSSTSKTDFTKNYKDVLNASTGLINSSSSNTLFEKDIIMNNDNIDNHYSNVIDSNLESSSDIDLYNSLSSNSTPSTLSLNLERCNIDENPQWLINNKRDRNNNNRENKNKILSLSPAISTPLTSIPSSFHNVNSEVVLKGHIQKSCKTPPILSYFPREILIHIAMSSDFDTILSLRQTCHFFFIILDNPNNWSDYWKYTSDQIECLNSLVTSVFQGDRYIFGEVLNPSSDKYITDVKKENDRMKLNGSDSSYLQPNYLYKMLNNSEKEIPIEKILFIDYFSSRLGFSYLGGLRIYIPYEYGNNIVLFYDRPSEELPCSMEHYQDYEHNKLKNDLSTMDTLELPTSVQKCKQCIQYYQTNKIDYTVTCSGRPVSNISAIWKYRVSPRYTISFDIINSRSEYGYGYRTEDAFIHTNYSFLVNGKELSHAKAALFRKYVLKTS
ncbi:hypothetical protein BCR36DRAFT_405396 [Piromyces finnis]|uniref:F-box domain-containing protein n=1 Tax=Piromyces finnis TaxID=1754191 RepID=A0A1Y1V4V0_9FUNG|nr:hypothetical protein BCR36DRAFT_405396 [Piromyces finnis]|eukprot:ORX47330.1 hypothetical protein BCR36DRAFT_405396 [Piromyces finnis]